MKQRTLVVKSIALVAVIVAVGLTASCYRPPAPAAPAASPANENGRFQIIVSAEGERGSVLFLIDTRDGATWIYRPPQAPAMINGFWSDIPRVTYPPEFWQRAFALMTQPPGTNAPAPGATPTPPPPPK
jgi:hypothetical protein